jgi:uncharacterized protein (UPF0332 family)
MTPRDILDVADELCMGLTEAEWRAAVSRAYFAAFHAARRLLRDAGFDVPRADQAHAYLWLRLSNCGHPDVEDAGRRLNVMRGLRNWADYDLDQPFGHAAAVGEVQSADDILRLLEALPTTPATLAQITVAIRDYERDVLKQVTWRP